MASVFTATAKRDRSSKARYDEDSGYDSFYDGSMTRYTIAETAKSTMKTYHSSMKSKTPQTLPYPTSISPGPVYDPKTTLLSGRRHGLISESPHTLPISTIHVREPGKQSGEFADTLQRFQTYAHPNKRATKISSRDYFALSHRDGNMYRFGSAFR